MATPKLRIVPGALDIEITKGITLDATFTLEELDEDGEVVGPFNLTGYTARFEIKSLDLLTSYKQLGVGTGLTLGGVAGTIRVQCASADIALFASAKAHYALELEKDTVIEPGFAGLFTRLDGGVDPA